MKMHDKFIGDNAYSCTCDFVGGDSESMFIENQKKMGEDWYYNRTPITYDLNKRGHRSKNIEDLDLSNYILFVGCSHTYGVGLELDNTYAYQLASMLNCDYYNLAIPAAGIDVLEYNLLTWFGIVHQKPKLVVIQMPDHSRFCSLNTHVSSEYLIESGTWATNPEEQRLVVNLEDTGFYSARKFLTYSNIDNVITVPKIKFDTYGQNNVRGNELRMRRIDLARDLSHNGILSNKKLSTDIYQYILLEFPQLVSDKY